METKAPTYRQRLLMVLLTKRWIDTDPNGPPPFLRMLGLKDPGLKRPGKIRRLLSRLKAI